MSAVPERTATPEFSDWYEARCAYATTSQGLDPIVEVLRAAGIPHTVDQTGGFCMCVNVPLVEGGSQYLYVTAGDLDAEAVVGRYWECGDDWHSEGVDVGVVDVGDELVRTVRAEIRNSPQPCPYCQ